MDFIKNCWNNLIPVDVFLKELKKESYPNNSSFSVNILILLFQLLNQNSNKILKEYISSIINDNPEILYFAFLESSFDLHNFMKFLTIYDNSIFEKFDIRNEKHCILSLKILEVCVINRSDEFAPKALSKLSSSPKLSILIAHAKSIYFYEFHFFFQQKFNEALKSEFISTNSYNLNINRRQNELNINFERLLDQLLNDFFSQDNHHFPELYPPNIIFPHTLLRHALFDFQTYVGKIANLLPRCELIMSLISDLHIFLKNPAILDFAAFADLCQTYLKTIESYLIHQSLTLAYNITNFFVSFLLEFRETGLISAPKNCSIYSAEKFHQLFQILKNDVFLHSNSFKFFEFNVSCDEYLFNDDYGHCFILKENSKFILKKNSFDAIETLNRIEQKFSEFPPTFDISEQFMQIILNYPAISTQFQAELMKILSSRDIENIAKITQCLINHRHDYRVYLLRRGKFFEMLDTLFKILHEITREDLFYPIWIFALSLARFSFGNGSHKFHTRFQIFLDGLEPVSLRYFLRLLLQIEPEKEAYISSNGSVDMLNSFNDHLASNAANNSPFEYSVSILDKLIHNEIHLSDILNVLKESPSCPKAYLWPIILIYAYMNPKMEEINEICRFKPPKEELLQLLFQQMMLKVSNSQKKWEFAAESFDSYIMRAFPPQDPNNISCILKKHFLSIRSNKYLNGTVILGIGNSWRALSDAFGEDLFMKSFINSFAYELSTSFDNINENCFSNRIFVNSVGFLFSLFLNTGTRKIKIAIDVTIDIICKEQINSCDIENLAKFLLIIINGADNLEENIAYISEKSVQIIKNKDNLSKPEYIFAIEILHTALVFPRMKEIVFNIAYNAILNTNEYLTIIDFMILKPKLVNK